MSSFQLDSEVVKENCEDFERIFVEDEHLASKMSSAPKREEGIDPWDLSSQPGCSHQEENVPSLLKRPGCEEGIEITHGVPVSKEVSSMLQLEIYWISILDDLSSLWS